MIWPQCLALLVLLCCSALFSGSETALFALTRHQLYRFDRSGRRSGKMVAQLMRRPRHVLLTILICNTTVNVLIFADGYVISQYLGGGSIVGALVGGVGSVLAVVVFGEVLPKAVAYARAAHLAPVLAPLIQACVLVLSPIRWMLNTLLVEPTTRLWLGPRRAARYVTTEELKMLLEMSQRHGVIDTDESTMLQQVVSLAELKVRNVMVPRVDVQAFDLAGDPEHLRELMRRTRLKKVPVYEQDLDRIVGLIYAKDVFLEAAAKDRPHRPLRDLVRPVRFVPEQITLAHLVAHFRQTRTQLAIVVDEYGGMAGLVALEDVLELIVGDIAEPGEPITAPPVQQIDERTFLIAGSLSVRDWANAFGVRVLDERIATVGGLMLAQLGRIAREGDRVRFVNLELTVERTRRRRIELLRLKLLEETQLAPGTEGDPARASAIRPGEQDSRPPRASGGGDGRGENT